MSLIAKCREMESFDWRALVVAAWRVGIAQILLSSLGVRRTQQLLARHASPVKETLEYADPWHRRALAVRRVARMTPGARCLTRSVVLWWWMRSQGFDPTLCMGVRPGVETIEGHAWIECDGHTIDEESHVAAGYSGLDWRSPK